MIIDSPIISGSYAASGSLNQFGDITVTGSLTVTGNITGTASVATSASYAANASAATSASYAATASYISGSGGGVGFPFSGSAVITGSLLITELSGSGTKYVITDNNGLLSISSGSTAIKVTEAITSTTNQTSFVVPNGYTTGLVDVFINGIKLSNAEFTDNDGVTITLATGSNDGDIVEFAKYQPANGVTNNALRQLTQFTATAGQTVFSASYTPGLLDVYYNGARLSNSDYTANNGTYITLATASAANDVLDVLVYSYQVGAFSGIGGQGVASQVAYFGTTNAITGSPNFTISGSTMTVTGSLVVTGSGTFTNIGPAVMSGSLTVSGAITTNSTITATTLVVQTVTSSVSYLTGSTQFGSLLSNTHVFSGSVTMNPGGLFVSSSGNVGIGATNPINPLLVAGTGVGAAGLIGMRGTNAHLGFQDASSIFKGWVGYFNLSLHGNDVDLNIKTGYKESSNIRFGVTGDSGEAMRISSNGNVSIGTTTSNSILALSQANSAASTTLEIINSSSASTTTKTSQLLFQIADTGGTVKQAANLIAGPDGVNNLSSYLAFGTRSGDANPPTERLRITSGGDILIAGGNTSGQGAVSACTALRFPNQYSSGYTDAGVKLFIFNSGATIQGFTAGPAYDLQYHSSGDNTNGKHAWYVGNVQVMRVQSTSGNVTILGSLSKGSGSFRIKHPLASKKNTHQLVHSFIEGPQADLLYSGAVTLVNGRAVINIDEAATMTEGTFEALCRNIRVFTSNETSWDNVRGKVEGNILTIECQNTESTDEISWLVIGERQDEHMMNTEWTDENGKVIVEPLIPVDPEVTSYN